MTTQEIWQSQALESPRISIHYARHLASELANRMRTRTRSMLILMIIIGAVMLARAFTGLGDAPLRQLAFLWIWGATTYEYFVLRRRMAVQTTPADAGVLDSLRFYRRELERQRDVPRHNPAFSLLLGAPGIVLLVASMFYEGSPLVHHSWVGSGVVAVVAVVVGLVGRWLHRREFNREITSVDLLLED